MGSVPVEAAYDPLRPPGAVMVQRDGLPVVGHYGSVAAEIAVCTKAAGLVDRSSIRQLAISGAEGLLDHVLHAAVPAGPPSEGHAICVAGTWCCRATARRAVVAGAPGAVTRWRQVASRAISTAGLAVGVELLMDSAALSLVGPRAARIVRAAGLPAELGMREVADGRLGGAPVTVVREDGDHFLLLFEHGHPAAVWQALWEAGRDHGLAPVGNEALELLQAAKRPLPLP
jgi:glycine cleavage system aminomethyltransferase T